MCAETPIVLDIYVCTLAFIEPFLTTSRINRKKPCTYEIQRTEKYDF